MTDYALGTTIYIGFTTRSFSTGVPTTLAGTPVLSVLEENNATPITSGVSVSVDRASVTGLNEATIVATSGNGYEAGKEYALYISTGTVGGTSVVGEVVGRFSVEKASALRPTTAGRTFDVSAGGEGGIDWANIGSPTTALALTGTTIATTQKVDVETIKTQSVTAAAAVTFPASIASPTNITAGTITTVTNLTNAPTAGDLTATMKTSIGTAVAASAVASVTGAVGSVTAGVTVTTNNDKTGYALSATGSAAMTEGYATLGAAATLPQLLYEVRALLAEKSINGTTLTAKKLDGSTTATTYTLDDATTPSAITRAT